MLKFLTRLTGCPFKITLSCLAGTLALAACSFTPARNTTSVAGTSNPGGIASISGYQVSLFASRGASYFQPDTAVVDGDHVFIDYQNNVAPDGSDKKSSTIVEYAMNGKVVKTFSVLGQSDGMRMDPTSKLLWVVSNKIANPRLETIDPVSRKITPYTFPKTPHRGGYDDVYFSNGSAFISASNPLPNNNGVNVFPAVDKISLSNGKVVLTSILKGNTPAVDMTAGDNNAVGNLNELDPESLTSDTKGNLVLVNQNDAELVFISKPGTAQQKVSRLAAGLQLDQVAWVTSTHGRFLVVDSTKNNIYWVQANFAIGTIYTTTANNSAVSGVLGTLNQSTDIVTPQVIGFGNPTGLLFVPNT